MNNWLKWSSASAILLLTACAGLPGEREPEGRSPGDESPVAEPSGPRELPLAGQRARNPAVLALLARAREQRASGALQHAAVNLERALRIDARDPEIWLELARVNMDQDNLTAAGQFARKARRLAGLDEAVAREAEKLIAALAAGST